MASLKAALQKEMYASVREATEQSFQDLRQEVSHFYDSAEGVYQRTGQLRDSPQLDGINFNGDNAVSQFSINTGTQYPIAGRDTATIYEYAEDGGLLGNGGFWQRTEEKIKDNIEDAFSKHFK